MRLAEFTDYSLRVLMYCAQHPEQLVTIGELAEHHRLSKNHLMKVVNDLARQGVLHTTRGRGGGLRLGKDPADIRVGDVVRAAESDFRLVECFDASTDRCTLTPSCRLKHVFDAALRAYFAQLDATTLADIAGPAGDAAGVRVLRRHPNGAAPVSRPRHGGGARRPRAAAARGER
ncbi:MAG: Rrf2 family transcriptional regulator [Burkholderiaceae bacterium]|nr:Rrf2 family transcriptional regulator [Burkholderiaceae bacterium]